MTILIFFERFTLARRVTLWWVGSLPYKTVRSMGSVSLNTFDTLGWYGSLRYNGTLVAFGSLAHSGTLKILGSLR